MSYESITQTNPGVQAAFLHPGQGESLADASGNGVTLSATRYGSPDVEYVAARYGAFAMRLGFGFLGQINAPLLAGRTVGTIAFNLRRDASDRWKNPVSALDASDDTLWRFETKDPANEITNYGTGWYSGTNITDALTVSIFHSVVLTADGTNVQAYFNGVQGFDTPLVGPLPAIASWLVGGRTPDEDIYWWRGRIGSLTWSHDHWQPFEAQQYEVGPSVVIPDPNASPTRLIRRRQLLLNQQRRAYELAHA